MSVWGHKRITLKPKRLSSDERVDLDEMREEMESLRPKTREDCRGKSRPCPWVGCQFHLYLDVKPNGNITFNFVDLEPWELEETCALDIVEREQGVTLETVGVIMNLTRERVRQVESVAKQKLRDTGDISPDDALD